MQCPACGFTPLRVLGNVQRFDAVDMRQRHCPECGFTGETEERLVAALVIDPATQRRHSVTVETFMTRYVAWHMGRGRHPNEEPYD